MAGAVRVQRTAITCFHFWPAEDGGPRAIFRDTRKNNDTTQALAAGQYGTGFWKPRTTASPILTKRGDGEEFIPNY